MNKLAGQEKIVKFPESVALAVEKRHIFESDLDRILNLQTQEIITLGSESNIQDELEFIALKELMQINYPLNFDSIEAIRYIVNLVTHHITCVDGRLVFPDENSLGKAQIPEADKLFLQYIFRIPDKDNFTSLEIKEYIELLYEETSGLYGKISGEVGNDLQALFMELSNIAPIICDLFLQELRKSTSHLQVIK